MYSSIIMANTRRIECTKVMLGRGSFGSVVKGRFDGREVAVKKIVIENVEERKREEFLTNFPHENILKLFCIEEIVI